MVTPHRRWSNRTTLGVAATALLLGIGALAVQADDWPMLRGDSRRSGVSEEKIVPPLTLLWRHTGYALSNNNSGPVEVGGVVYYAGRAQRDGGGVVFAVDAKTGARKWVFPNEGGLRERNLFTTVPYVMNGSVYVGAADGNLYVLDAASGNEVKKFVTASSVNSSPLIDDNVLYFGSNDRKFYALDPETGALVWKQVYKAQDAVNSAPILADGSIYFTTSDQYIHAIKLPSGKLRWSYRVPYRFLPNAPIFADNTIYLPSGPRLNAIQPNSGNLRWGRDLNGDILTPAVAEGGIVYVSTRNSRTNQYEMYALRSVNGREVWKKPVPLPFAPSAAPTISGDIIYVPTSRSILLALSREDGKVLWQYRVQPSVSTANATPANDTSLTSSVAIANGTLYTLSDDGTLSAFRADAPDMTAPLTSNLYPAPGQRINGGPGMVVAAKVLDPGSGLDPSTLKLLLDDKDMGADFDLSRNLVYYRTKSSGKIIDPPLANGRHTVTVVAKDFRGNQREHTWSFVVDNNMAPPATTIAPPPAPRPGGIGAPGRGGGNPPGRNP